MALRSFEFHAAARSDIGLVRRTNQDSAYAGQNLLVLADGMGGPAGGDIASSVAVAHLAPLDQESHPAEVLLPLLRARIADAHDELVDRSSRVPELQGLGTTCIALMCSGNKLAMVHIGDSRAYLLRGGHLTQVTTDHSFVQYLVDSGQITPDEAEHHPQRNVVMRVLGDLQADVTPDETIREGIDGDRWLLCSDGLSGVVSADTIESLLASIPDPGECADELIRLALLAGAPDNVTCVVADVVPVGAAHSMAPQIVGAAAKERTRPSRGSRGAAGKAAAALAAVRGPAPVDDEDEDTPSPGRSAWWWPLLTLAVIAAVLVGGWLGYAWTQTQYYVIATDGKVVIHQGIPQTLGPWELSHPVEVTDVDLDDLDDVDRERLAEPVVRSSREEIDAYVASLEQAAQRHRAEAEAAQSGAAQSGAAQSGATQQPTGDQ